MSTISMPILWLIVFAILIVIEFITMGLTTIWFACGSILACIAAAFGLPIWIQIALFIIVSGVLLFFTRPVAMKYFNRSRTRTNVESMIGKQAVVISDIDNIQGIGQVKVAGMDWTARSFNGEPISAGTVTIVKAVEGVKLIVEEEK